MPDNLSAMTSGDPNCQVCKGWGWAKDPKRKGDHHWTLCYSCGGPPLFKQQQK